MKVLMGSTRVPTAARPAASMILGQHQRAVNDQQPALLLRGLLVYDLAGHGAFPVQRKRNTNA